MRTAKGKDLIFISQIKRDGSGTRDLTGINMSYLDDITFAMNPLSLTNGTYIASGFNSYVVRLRNNL